jgi:hypothetical protein
MQLNPWTLERLTGEQIGLGLAPEKESNATAMLPRAARFP